MAAPAFDVALTVPCTEAEGPGKRFALWVQGCDLGCRGCCNPHMWPFDRGRAVDVAAVVDDVRAAVAAHGIEGVSVLGGEPFRQAAALAAFVAAIKDDGLSVMVFTGFTLAELRAGGAAGDVDVDAALAAIDVLVDGRYDETQRTTTRRFVGSDNQVVHFLSDRYTAHDARFAADNTLELRLTLKKSSDGGSVLTLNGWPTLGARTR